MQSFTCMHGTGTCLGFTFLGCEASLCSLELDAPSNRQPLSSSLAPLYPCFWGHRAHPHGGSATRLCSLTLAERYIYPPTRNPSAHPRFAGHRVHPHGDELRSAGQPAARVRALHLARPPAHVPHLRNVQSALARGEPSPVRLFVAL